MSIKNRTVEFQAIVESARQRNAVQQNGKGKDKKVQHKVTNAISFTKLAASVGKDINATASKLELLTKLVKKKSIFDDRQSEIQKLTYAVKEDIRDLNHKIEQLKQYNESQRPESAQASNFSKEIVVSLQSKLATASFTFKDILMTRTRNMEIESERRKQFSGNPLPLNKVSSNSALYRRGGGSERLEKEDSVTIDMSQTMELVPQQDNYAETRHEEIRNIESVINQLATIFQQLATLVQQQGEQVQTIDQNIEDAEANILEGEKQLLSYWQSISSDRWLMLKVFGVLIVFFVVFVFFFA